MTYGRIMIRGTPPSDFTKQENIIAEVLSECGLRYKEQENIGKYYADFFVPELNTVIEADGIYGHLKKRDVKRDADIMRIYGVENILHIKENSKAGVKDTLWQALNKLAEEPLSQKLESEEQPSPRLV